MIRNCFLIGLMTLLAAGAAIAQPPSPLRDFPRRPGYSPYLNLTRTGGNAAQNYYGLVRPELEFRNNVNQLRNDTQAIAAGLAAAGAATELSTGHATGYMTHLRYFGTNGMNSGLGAVAPTKQSPAVKPANTRPTPAPIRR